MLSNEKFNKKIKNAFNKHSQDQDLVRFTMVVWLNNNTTEEQDKALERLKNDAFNGQASNPERYTVKKKGGG